MIISHTNLTDTGLVRKTNQDAVFADSDGDVGIFVIADGMGGHSCGDIASQAVIAGIYKWWYNLGDGRHDAGIEELLMGCEAAIMEANDYLYQRFHAAGQVGGTTVSALIVNATHFAVLNIGDSRIYRSVGGGVPVQITVDDVWQNLPQNASLTETELISDKRYGKLTAAVGAASGVKVKLFAHELESYERFILCSDGIYKYCLNGELENMAAAGVAQDSDEVTARMLEDFVRASGANDNYSLIIVTLRRG